MKFYIPLFSFGLAASGLSCSVQFVPPTTSQLVRPSPQYGVLHASADGMGHASAVQTEAGGSRQEVLQAVKTYLQGEPLVANGYEFENNSLGFVRAAFWMAHIELFNEHLANRRDAEGMQVLYRSAALRKTLHYKTPRPGDLVFFDEDARKTQPNPALVAIVEAVEGNGTITAAGIFAEGTKQVKFNLREPTHIRSADGELLNDVVTTGQSYTLGQLFRAFASPYET